MCVCVPTSDAEVEERALACISERVLGLGFKV